MTTLKELIIKRPSMKLEFLDTLLDFCSHDKPEVRNNAIRVTKKLHECSDLKAPIEVSVDISDNQSVRQGFKILLTHQINVFTKY